MQFNSIDFMLFFPIVLAVYFIIPKKLRKLWLLVASYYFYMSWNAKYAILIGGSTVITYLSGLLFAKFEESDRASLFKKRIVMISCIVINLGILAIFKYGNFAIDTVSGILSRFGISPIERRLNFLLPVGISFYTFQALGYMIDVYRGDIKARKNFIDYALFVSFFPQLVAGPIERSKNLLSQIEDVPNLKLWNAERVTRGAILMVWGFFMKMVIADRVAILVDNVFNDFRMYGSSELIAAALGFTLQIYCDFGSYSMIAIGAAKILGIDLMENFNTPYLAQSIRDFWSRWHISLSTWFRDYLYIPLGGNRKGRIRQYINLMIVFLVSGLWHGAGWNFVVWGGIHGFYQVAGHVLKPLREKLINLMNIRTECFSWKLLRVISTFTMVSSAWVFFRSDTFIDALAYFKRIIIRPTPWLLFNGGIYELGLDRPDMNVLFVSIIILLLVDLVRYLRKQTIDSFLLSQNIWFEWTVLITLILMIFIFGKYGPEFDAKQFIYFQF